MSDLFPNSPKEYVFTGDDLVLGMQRELDYRHKVYPRLIEKGTMTKADAARHIALCEVVIEHLQATALGKTFKRVV